jgi:RAD50-interacting protein 1
MAFLHKALASVTFRRIWHEALDALQDLLWNEVLMRERFTTPGATQFYRDLTAVWAIIDEFIPDGSSSALGMPKLREGAQLLNLPIMARDGLMSLSSAYDRVYADNMEARKVIDELGFSTITYVDARLILQRRVEASD